jgi:XTP/dITP diphosphohydrolase
MIPTRLVLATSNRGKAAELATLVREWGAVDVLTLDAFPGAVCPEEGDTSYADNARAKAVAVASASGLPALADDSGLEVDALGGAPGVRSARWAASDGAAVQKLIGALGEIAEENRGARFRCAVALAWPDGRVVTAEGVCGGRIARAPQGTGGFGYDPVFVSAELGVTFAEATATAKQRVSHRALAVRALGTRLLHDRGR